MDNLYNFVATTKENTYYCEIGDTVEVEEASPPPAAQNILLWICFSYAYATTNYII